MNIALKITSYLSVLLAVFLLYKLVEELSSEHNYPISDISPVAILITLFVMLNAVLSVLHLMKRIKSSQSIFIVQIIILSIASLVLYQVFFNSTISCS